MTGKSGNTFSMLCLRKAFTQICGVWVHKIWIPTAAQEKAVCKKCMTMTREPTMRRNLKLYKTRRAATYHNQFISFPSPSTPQRWIIRSSHVYHRNCLLVVPNKEHGEGMAISSQVESSWFFCWQRPEIFACILSDENPLIPLLI